MDFISGQLVRKGKTNCIRMVSKDDDGKTRFVNMDWDSPDFGFGYEPTTVTYELLDNLETSNFWAALGTKLSKVHAEAHVFMAVRG